MQAADFLKNIIDHPENDEYRLVYADWLMQRDDPRGEFIRLQCELFKMSHTLRHEVRANGPIGAMRNSHVKNDHPTPEQLAIFQKEVKKLEKRQANLLKNNKRRWLEPFHEATSSSWEFERGFVDRVYMFAKHLIRIIDIVMEIEPVQEIYLQELKKGQLQQLLCTQGISKLNTLHLRDNRIEYDDIIDINKGNRLQHLSRLDLGSCEIDAHVAQALSRLDAAILPCLTDLGLSRNPLSDGGLSCLVESDIASNITSLYLNYCNITLKNWIADKPLGRLKTLSLGKNKLDKQGLIHFLEHSNADKLETLCLDHCKLNDKALDIFNLPLFPSLKRLDIVSNEFTQKGLARLADAKGLDALESLAVSVVTPHPTYGMKISTIEALESRFNLVWSFGGLLDIE